MNRIGPRLTKIEEKLKTREVVPMVAMRYLDGSYHWNGHVFDNEEEFHAALNEQLKGKTGGHFIIISKRSTSDRIG